MVIKRVNPVSAAKVGGVLFGAGTIVLLPIFHGCAMFRGALLQAALHNMAAKWTGEIEIDAA